MKKRFSYGITLVVTLALLSSVATIAQGPGGPGGGPGPCPSPPCGPPNPPGLAPIDGGIVFLLVSGLVLGVTSLRKKK